MFVSASPDDAGTVIVPVETPGRLRIAGLPTGFRAYVHVLDLDGRWVVAGERLIRLSRHVQRRRPRRPPRRRRAVGALGAALRRRSHRRPRPGRSLGAWTGSGSAPCATCGAATPRRGGRPWLDPAVRWELPGLGEGEDAQVAEVGHRWPPIRPAGRCCSTPAVGLGPRRRGVRRRAERARAWPTPTSRSSPPGRRCSPTCASRYGSVERYLTGGCRAGPRRSWWPCARPCVGP